MISDLIPFEAKSAVARGLPEGSIWRVRFTDGSEREETDTSWAAMAELRRVDYFGAKKSVMVCKFPVEHIWVFHEKLETDIEVPPGTQAYQMIRSNIQLAGGRERQQILGRCVGLVRDGKVIEERFLNAVQNEVIGAKS